MPGLPEILKLAAGMIQLDCNSTCESSPRHSYLADFFLFAGCWRMPACHLATPGRSRLTRQCLGLPINIICPVREITVPKSRWRKFVVAWHSLGTPQCLQIRRNLAVESANRKCDPPCPLCNRARITAYSEASAALLWKAATFHSASGAKMALRAAPTTQCQRTTRNNGIKIYKPRYNPKHGRTRYNLTGPPQGMGRRDDSGRVFACAP